MSYSITISPHVKDFNIINSNVDILKNYIQSISTKYLISLEKGSSDEFTHYQIYIKINRRIDSLRLGIKNLIIKQYNLQHLSSNKRWLRVKTIKSNNDELYVIGYCLKEGHNNYTNIDDNEKEKCIDYFIKNPKKKIHQKHIILTHINFVFEFEKYINTKDDVIIKGYTYLDSLKIHFIDMLTIHNYIKNKNLTKKYIIEQIEILTRKYYMDCYTPDKALYMFDNLLS